MHSFSRFMSECAIRFFTVAGLGALAACQTASLPEGETLSAAEIQSEIVGSELQGTAGNGTPITISVKPDGSLSGTYRGISIRGTYEVTDDGKWCRDFAQEAGGAQCQTIVRDGEKYVFVEENGQVDIRAERR